MPERMRYVRAVALPARSAGAPRTTRQAPARDAASPRFARGPCTQLASLLAALAAGCAGLPAGTPDDPALQGCAAQFQALDRRTEAARLFDAGAHRVAGFPYLRSDRFLASFREEVKDGAPFAAWMERMRQLDLDARRVELRNLGEPAPVYLLQALDRCGREWAAHDAKDTQRRAALRENAAVPDDYSLAQRVFGLYPVAAPFLKWGVGGYREEMQQMYARPLRSLDSPGPLTLWQPPKAQAASAARAARWLQDKDALGVPRLDAEQWRRLAEAHAPHWWLETGGPYDRPGAPRHQDGAPGLDTSEPVVYFRPGYTRFRGDVLPQISYVMWFAARPAQGWLDGYAGVLDGVVWRVTLDRRGRPLVYDTIHPCGCYHQVFAYQRLWRDRPRSFWEDPPLMPQPKMPAAPFAIRVQSGTHFVRRLVALREARADARQRYELREYRELLSLPTLAGVARSLFDDEGLVPGTARLERFWLWPSGVASPGAMRQAGRQATAFVGRSHFDDPFLLERWFEPRKKPARSRR